MINYAQALQRYGARLQQWPWWLWPLATLTVLSPRCAALRREFMARERDWQRQLQAGVAELVLSRDLQQRLAAISQQHAQLPSSQPSLAWPLALASVAAVLLGLALGVGEVGQFSVPGDDYQGLAYLDITGSRDIDAWLEGEL